MALVATLKDSGQIGLVTTAVAVSGSSAAVTIGAGSLIVVVLGTTKSTAGTSTFAVTATGLTFTQQAIAQQLVADKGFQTIWTAPDASGGSRTINMTSGSNVCYGLYYAVYEITGQHASPIGATAAVADNLTAGAKTMTLSAAPATSSIVLAAVSADTNAGTNQIDVGSGWTEDVELDSAGGTNTGVMQVQRRTGSTSTSVDWASVKPTGSASVFSTAGAALEIIAASGAAAAVQQVRRDRVPLIRAAHF